MNAGAWPQAAFIQGNESAVEKDSSKSALFYLFQEVSKLAPPVHNGFCGANSLSLWLNDASRQDPFADKKKEAHVDLTQTPNTSCQCGLSNPSSRLAFAASRPKCHSPWRVLSLINLQCERLMHPRDVEEPDTGSCCLSTALGTDAIDVGVEGGCDRDESIRPPSSLFSEQHNLSPRVGPVADEGEGHSGRDDDTPQRCLFHCHLQPQVTKELDTVTQELLEESSQREKTEVKVDLSRIHIPALSLGTQLTSVSNEDAAGVQSKAVIALDINANLVQLAPSGSKLRSSQFTLPSTGIERTSVPFLKQETLISSNTGSTVYPLEETSTPVAHLNSPSCCGDTNRSQSVTKPQPRFTQNTESAGSQAHPCASSSKWKTKTRRKQPNPSRSADIQDPHFQGVTFRMETELDESRDQCRLLITSKYSKELCKTVRKSRLRTRESQRSFKVSSSDEESDPANMASKGKVCASCCTKKTPMWRDAEDGTPLCNACGIRYKKYRVRCVHCWHIPRKESNSNSCCLKCGNSVR